MRKKPQIMIVLAVSIVALWGDEPNLVTATPKPLKQAIDITIATLYTIRIG